MSPLNIKIFIRITLQIDLIKEFVVHLVHQMDIVDLKN